ncbi:type II toxin-antitoxin system Phd/YefM family antitoxin [Candidatus Tisiphia endosymbiont of Hybos culiciformis]|uniref:type II toxin-antitoxin system Phd/YefM family antitoxin n=1 Tax=Candidatus Tisiphia endosymbiont of Hybos culiciformis TaxID=3139331 RepID=UPI003CCA71DE
MRTYSTNEARNKFAEIIDIARREPVAIAKHGRVVSIILAKEDYEHYQEIEEQYWMNYKTVPAEDCTEQVNARIEKLEQKLLHT